LQAYYANFVYSRRLGAKKQEIDAAMKKIGKGDLSAYAI
jgi:hypothetical protein